jgi:outer membrane protein
MNKQLIVAVAAASLGLGALSAQAHEQGDIIFRGGIATVAPNTDSDAIELPPPVGVLPNGVDVDNGTAISLIGAWMINNNWALELLAATPFEHDIDLEDAPLAAGSTKHLPPTLSLQWYPRGGMDGWQPYIGVGINYTTFFDEEVDPALGAFLGETLGVTSARLSLDDSVGVAVQAGVDIPINEKWYFNAGIWWIDIGTTADIDVGFEDGSAATVSFDVDIDPMVYNIGFAYKF